MPRVIVTTDPSELPEEAPVLLDERVHSVHLSTGHAAAQLVERLAWAISDAEDAERACADLPAQAPRQLSSSPLQARPSALSSIGA